jgi:hypothetical protein
MASAWSENLLGSSASKKTTMSNIAHYHKIFVSIR